MDDTARDDDARRARSADAARLVALRAWAVVGCVVVFLVAVRGLALVGSALECLLVAVIIGFICSSITNWLEDRGLPRALGALVSLVVVLGVAVGIVALLGPMFFEELSQLLERVPAFFSQVQDGLRDLWQRFGTDATADVQASVQQVLGSVADVGTRMAGDLATRLSSGIVPNVMGMANSLLMFFLGLVMAYWFAKDYPGIVREAGVIVGPRYRDDLTLMLAVLSRSMGGYMRGIVVTSVINGVLAFVGFSLIGHPYAGLMAILTGILHFVPVVGPALAALVATLVALFGGPAMAFWTLVIAVVAQNVTDNVISPLVMRSAVKIHPAMSLIGITVGASLGGPLGMAMAVPLTAAIKGVFVYYFETRTSRQLVSYEGAFFQGTPFHHEDGSPAPTFDALDDDQFLSQTRLVSSKGAEHVEPDQMPDGMRPSMADLLRIQARGIGRVHAGFAHSHERAGSRSRRDSGRADSDGSGSDDDKHSEH